MFKKFFSTTVFPIVFMLVGLFFILLGIWGNLSSLWQQTWDTLGKTMFVSGSFAGLLKLMQIHGVFMQELEKLIFEPKFLKNRKDIPDYWEKVSQELFKNKFPGIRRSLLNDIKNTYLPTREMVYYDKAEHFIELTLHEDGTVDYKKSTSLNIICTDGKKTPSEYEFGTTFRDVNGKKSDHSYSTTVVKVNGQNRTATIVEDGKYADGQTFHKAKIELCGNDEYELEREDLIKFNLGEDDIIVFRATKLTHTLSLTISHSSNLDVQLTKMGTLDQFITKQNGSTIKKLEYKGILYKEQGYFIKLRRVN